MNLTLDGQSGLSGLFSAFPPAVVAGAVALWLIVQLIIVIVLAVAAVAVATSAFSAGKEIYYEAKGAERFDGGMGHAVPRVVVYWFGGAALVALGGAYAVRER